MTEPAIVVEGLAKRFGKVEALKGVDLQVPPSTVLGLLGPNGAGKTTAVRILTTLLHPDEGRATVAGYDVVKQAEQLRHVIGLAGQNAAVDENLTGLENLEMVGRLYHVPAAEAKRRGEEILERFDLAEAAHRVAKTYSGGMRRRLDLGASLVGKPKVLFLDEPTTGLDPRGRMEMWDVIRGLVMEGTTLLLTTQYLDEADRLADKIAVIDLGLVIAEGTSDELKGRVGGEVLALRVADRDRAAEAAGTVLGLGPGGGNVDNNTGEINVPVGDDGTAILTEAVRRLDAEGIKLADVALRRPTLDDVFLALTGHAAEQAESGEPAAEEDGGKKRRRERKREKV
ncbi:MAG TPA: ATP-binding cassette domain-containing protein [Actinomycetota bacterium]|jgi:ABC-2 type transport system ATP-binding protein|nr:ATP-binding cassette domain-containing protein [Candidatus Limnocylindrales bacterium]HEX5902095.1 ATP-binding cassette domain-containing protein [Actinomycetota bacterium]